MKSVIPGKVDTVADTDTDTDAYTYTVADAGVQSFRFESRDKSSSARHK